MRYLRGMRSLIRKGLRRERAQILTLTAVLVTAVMGFTALAVDMGIFMRDLRDAQNDVDAAVLAGAQELLSDPPNTAAAADKAREWATRNGVQPEHFDCCTFSDANGDGVTDTISARVDRSSGTFFARVLGLTSLPVEREATARVVHSAGGPICPWGILGDPNDLDPSDGTYLGVEPGEVYVMKTMTGLQVEGNFRILDLGQTGTNGYVALIMAGCVTEDANVWREGDDIVTNTKPGNVGQPTRKALNDYYEYEKSDGISDPMGYGWCDVEFELDPTDPTRGTVTGAYNPYEDGVREGCDRNPITNGMGRVAMIPIIDHLPSGSSEPVTIIGIASMYVAFWDRTGPPSDTQVYGVFLEHATVTPANLVGESDNVLAPLRIKLVQND
ncbi:MAG: hypothetical protein QME71_10590 [Dehalococcoidia bacterium]|nr:hypothetical protein [Dehalococcoidia bacterium]